MISRARRRAGLGLCLVLATRALVFAQPAPCPTGAPSESCARTELGIPPDVKRVVIVSQSSHLDWDWRHTFDEYFQGPLDDPLLFLRPGPVETIFSEALDLMTASHSSPAHYYSVAEMGFLQRFVEARPDRLDALRAVGQDLRIVGGGITSPDNLLPTGEAFIRDYLVGKTWVDATLGLPLPGNHHDFITGTALDPVYENEQLPRLTDALAAGEAERTRALDEIVAAIRPRERDAPDTVVFNPLGFARRDLVEAPGAPTRPDEQASADGGHLFFARVPSLGNATADRARTQIRGRASLRAEPDGSVVVLENQHLRATLTRDAGWGITSLVDKHTGREVLRPGDVGNALVPYADDGGLYRFGDEMKGCSLVPQAGVVVGGAGSALEAGPLRARFVADVTVDGRQFRKEYQLVAGEPYLRMISSGSAASGTSVMVQFPLAGPIDELVHGTPYHWDTKQPERAGKLTFEATHEFLVPEF